MFTSPFGDPKRGVSPSPSFDGSRLRSTSISGLGFLSHSARRGSTASSIHSIGGSLDTSASTWGNEVLESGQNAISTLLQPPILRTGLQPHTAPQTSHKAPTPRDIPPVTLTSIQKIDPTEFRPYLSQISALYEKLQRAKEIDDNITVQPDSSASSLSNLPITGLPSHPRKFSRVDDEDIPIDHPAASHHHRPSSRGTMSRRTSASSVDIPGHGRRPSSAHGRRTGQGPPPLSTIPIVYFDEDFHLENPRTFDVVSEKSEVIRPGDEKPGGATAAGTANSGAGARKTLATNAILQEKLSWYMDTIEIHLINSISTASMTFFSALGSLRELHTEAADCVDRIRKLRAELMAMDHEIVSSGMDLIAKRKRRENVQALNDAVVQMRRVVEGLGYCESLVDANEAEKALETIEALELLIAGEKDCPIGNEPNYQPSQSIIDLRGAVALRGINSDFNVLRLRIGKSYEMRFQEVLKADLQRHCRTVSKAEVLSRWSSSSLRARGGAAREAPAVPSYMQQTEELRKDLIALLPGLHQANHVAAAVGAYRDWIIHEIRAIVKRPLPSSNDDDNLSVMSSSTSRSGGGKKVSQEILKRNLQALGPEDAEELWTTVYVNVAEAMRRLSTQAKVLLDVASSVDDPGGPDGVRSPVLRSPLLSPNPSKYSDQEKSVFEEMHESLDLANLMGKAVDMAQDRIIRVLRVRSEQSTHLPLKWFLRYFTLNLFFATECESISGRSGTALKTIVNGHIMEFVKEHGNSEIQRLAQGMESDNWNVKDFDEADSALLTAVLESGSADPKTWQEDTEIWKPYSDVTDDVDDHPPPPPPPLIAKDSQVVKEDKGHKEKEKAHPAIIGEEAFHLPNSAIMCLQGITRFMRLTMGIPSLTVDIAASLVQYLQLFNSRCRQLILGAGATRSASLRTITTKHLALAVRSINFIELLIPCIADFIRRHGTASPAMAVVSGDFKRIGNQLTEHQDNIFQKLVEIMSGRAVVHANALRGVDWANADVAQGCHPFAESLVKDTSMLHRVLGKFLPKGAVNMIMLPVFASFKEHLGKALREVDAGTHKGKDSMRADVQLLVGKLAKIEGFADLGECLIGIVESKVVESPAEQAEGRKSGGSAEGSGSGSGGTASPVVAEES